MSPTIAVIGPDDATREQELLATEVGRLLAEEGVVVVCGGHGGVMGAVAQGTRAAGGTCIGLLPGTDRSEGHPSLSWSLPTGLGEARNLLVVRAADAAIAIGGAYGTLSEIGFALKLGRPVVGLGTWTMRRGDGTEEEGVLHAEDPYQAVRLAVTACR